MAVMAKLIESRPKLYNNIICTIKIKPSDRGTCFAPKTDLLRLIARCVCVCVDSVLCVVR